MKKSLYWVLLFLVFLIALPVSEMLVEESSIWIGTWPTVILCIVFVYFLAKLERKQKKKKNKKHDE